MTEMRLGCEQELQGDVRWRWGIDNESAGIIGWLNDATADAANVVF